MTFPWAAIFSTGLKERLLPRKREARPETLPRSGGSGPVGELSPRWSTAGRERFPIRGATGPRELVDPDIHDRGCTEAAHPRGDGPLLAVSPENRFLQARLLADDSGEHAAKAIDGEVEFNDPALCIRPDPVPLPQGCAGFPVVIRVDRAGAPTRLAQADESGAVRAFREP